jgi:DNA-binding transcriptional ArsR family regulator
MLICLYVIGDIMSCNMNKNLTGNIEEFCNALSTEERISLVKALGVNEVCACRLIERTCMHPIVLSNQMHVLRHAGIISERKEADGTYYTVVNNEAIEVAFSGSCAIAVNMNGNIHTKLPVQNIDTLIGKYRSSYVYEAEALFRRGC